MCYPHIFFIFLNNKIGFNEEKKIEYKENDILELIQQFTLYI